MSSVQSEVRMRSSGGPAVGLIRQGDSGLECWSLVLTTSSEHVSPAGDRCGCSSYPTLLYALSSGAALLLLLLLAGCVVFYKVSVVNLLPVLL